MDHSLPLELLGVVVSASRPHISPGDRVRVLPQFDIPPMFRPGGLPSEGVVEHVHDDTGTLVVIVDGKAVPYQPDEVEVVS